MTNDNDDNDDSNENYDTNDIDDNDDMTMTRRMPMQIMGSRGVLCICSGKEEGSGGIGN